MAALAAPAPDASAQAQERGRAAVEWAPDGWILVSAGGLLARFDLASDQDQVLDDSGVTFTFCGARLVVAGRQRVELRSYPAYEVVAALPLPEPPAGEVVALACSPESGSPNGATLAAGTRTGHILFWDVEGRELWADLAVEPAGPVARLSFSADGTRLLSAFADGRAVLWDLERREVVRRFEPARPSGEPPLLREGESEPGEETSFAAVSPDGRRVLRNRSQGDDSEMALLDESERVVWRRSGYALDFTPPGEGVLALAPPFRIAALYRASDAEALRIFEPPRGVQTLYFVRLSPDGTKLVGVGEDDRGQILILWDFATARVLKTRR